MDFWRAYEILQKRWTLIALSVLASCFLTYGLSRLLGSNWLGTVRFVTAPSVQLPASPGQSGEAEEAEYIADTPGAQGQATLYEALIKSPDVLQPALAKLRQPVPPDDILANIKVVSKGARAYEIQVQDKSPERATLIANSLADNLVTKNRALYTQHAQEIVKQYQDATNKAKNDLNLAVRQYNVYKTRHNVLSTETEDLELAMNRLQQAYRDRDDAASKLAFAQARLLESENQLRTMPATIATPRSAADNPMIKKLEEDLARVESELTQLSARYTDEMMPVRIKRAERDGLQRQLTAEIEKNSRSPLPQPNPAFTPLQGSVADLRREISGYTAQLATLNQTIQAAENNVRAAGGANSPLGALATEINNKREELSNIQGRLNRSQLALDAAQRQNPIMILARVEPLNPPVNVTPGRTKKFLFLALLCSLVLSTGFVLAHDLVDRRVKSVKDAELLLPLPVTAAIPLPQSALSPAQLARITEVAPQSLSSEAYHFLALRLLNMKDQRIRSAMVVSAKAGQGTTQTVTNLGITLAQAGYRVVVVDANFRTPQIHALFNLPNDFGFTDLLDEPDVSLSHVLHDTEFEHLRVLQTERKRAEAQLLMALHPTSVENLHVITSGKPPTNPWELFRSRNLKTISTRLEEFADYVLFDTPSALAFTDALNLTPVADGAFLCVRALETPSGAEERLIEALNEANVVNLGVVLTDVPEEMLDSTPNYQHYYPTPAPTPSASLPSVQIEKDQRRLNGVVVGTQSPAIIDAQSPYSTPEEGWNDYVVEEDPKKAAS